MIMATEVLAPLAGGIWQVLVKVGDEVEEDDELLVIEALKMEHLVYAPCDGKVSEIRVKKGDTVEDDDVLMTIEEA
jgi:biotin carboxyl carrier protein